MVHVSDWCSGKKLTRKKTDIKTRRRTEEFHQVNNSIKCDRKSEKNINLITLLHLWLCMRDSQGNSTKRIHCLKFDS